MTARRPLLALLLAAAAAFAVWSPSLTGGFLLDDESNFLANPAVREPARWPRFFYGAEANSLDARLAANYRPLATLSYALTARLAGFNVFFFHLLDVAGHAANTALVLLIAWELCGSLPAAAAGALLFAFHPAQAESVSYVSGARPSVFSLLFCLLSLRAHLRRRRAVSVAWFAVAALFKESALGLPLALAAWDWAADPSRRGLKEAAKTTSAHFAVAAVLTVVRTLALGQTTDTGLHGGGLASQLEFAFTGLFVHARSAFWPYGQSQCYTVPVPADAGAAVAGAVLLAAVAGLLVYGVRARRAWLGPLAWAAAFLLPVSNLLVPRAVLAADRFLYASFAGLAWLLALAAARLPRRWAVAPAAALAAWLLPLCLERQIDWQSSFHLDLAAHAAREDACGSVLLITDYFNWGMKPRARSLVAESLARRPSPALRARLAAVQALLDRRK